MFLKRASNPLILRNIAQYNIGHNQCIESRCSFQEIFYIAVGILSAITIHECAHAWVADKLGDDTAKMEGRVTLNPLAHLDFFGTLMFILSLMPELLMLIFIT